MEIGNGRRKYKWNKKGFGKEDWGDEKGIEKNVELNWIELRWYEREWGRWNGWRLRKN